MASEQDAEAIAWVRALSWQVAAEQGLVSSIPDLGVFATVVREWGRRLADPGFDTLAVLHRGEIVGYALLRDAPDGDVTDVVSAHVRPTHWHSRAADNLVLSARDMCMQNGRRILRIEVASDNAAVQHTLIRCGFWLHDKTVRRCQVHHRYILWLHRG